MNRFKVTLLIFFGFLGIFLFSDVDFALATPGGSDSGDLSCYPDVGSCWQRTEFTLHNPPNTGCYYLRNTHIDWGGQPSSWQHANWHYLFKTGPDNSFDWTVCSGGSGGWIRLPSNIEYLELLSPMYNFSRIQLIDVQTRQTLYSTHTTANYDQFVQFRNNVYGANYRVTYPTPFIHRINVPNLGGRYIGFAAGTTGVIRIKRDESPPAKPVLSVRPACRNDNTPSTRRVDEVSWTSGGNGANHTLIAWHGTSFPITASRGNATFYNMGERDAYPTNFSGKTVTYYVQAEKNGHRVLSDPVGANHRCFHRTITTTLPSVLHIDTGGRRTFSVYAREWENNRDTSRSFSVTSSNPLIRVTRIDNGITVSATDECEHDGEFATITLSSSGFSPVRRNVYIKNTCSSDVLGDIGAGGEVEGIKVDNNSVIAAEEITNIDGSPTRVRGYSEGKWNVLVEQQREVIEKLKSEKAKLLLNGISVRFNLSTGSSDNKIDPSNPDGGVWFVRGDVTIGSVQWCGKGTIIIDGTLTIPANTRWGYNGSCLNSSLGIIANKIIIGKGAKIVGSFFAFENITINGTNIIRDETIVKGVLASEEITLVDQGTRIEYDGRVTSNPPLGFSESIAPIIRAGIR